MDKKKIYFPNLDGLRFIAAFLVIIHHIEQFKSISNMESYWGTIPFIAIIGKIGVVLFFVLSGFLITYLLLAEEQTFKTISIRKFYIRRMLRIWPLYYLIIILSFFVLPNIDLFNLPGYGPDTVYSNLFSKLFLYAIFFPNLVLSLFGMVPYASHTWSIGTEEQYYLIWPVVLKYCKKYRTLLMLFIIVCYLGFGKLLVSDYMNDLPFKNVLSGFWLSFNINCMATGGIYAILLFQKSRLLHLIRNNILFYSTIVLVTVLLIYGIHIPYTHYEIYSIFFGIIILNFATNQNIKISLEHPLFNYLGKISYGLYMYHPIAIVLAIAIAESINLISNWLLYPLTFVLTIILAGLSYKYFESYFLKFKHRFSKILSGNTTKKRRPALTTANEPPAVF